MSVKGSATVESLGGAAVIRAAYLRKLKTLRKKWFVLRGETREFSACLEYYDTEKKFNSGHPPKRRIQLKTCFNINKRSDTKHKHVIALYTKDDCFCVVLDTDEDMDAWLKGLLKLQHGEDVADGEVPRPYFEHVWQVKMLARGLGETNICFGRVPDDCVYRLCLTAKTLSLIRMDWEMHELALSCIRSCGSLKNFFYLELGRSSPIGAGELWMDADDTNIAQNIHHTVLHAMVSAGGSNNKTTVVVIDGEYRKRASSATESSNPNFHNNLLNRKPLHTANLKPVTYNQDTPNTNESLAHPASTTSAASAARHTAVSGMAAIYQLIQHVTGRVSQRRHSISAGGVTWPGTVNHQRTQSLPLANPAPLTDHTTHPPRAAKRPNQSSKCLNSGTRERCDSMPSRPRTTSEGNHALPVWGMRLHPMIYRPQSLYVKDMSHSPPTESPMSPPSASTDSTGSSLSIDEAEAWPENAEGLVGRYSNSLTPDEPIAEDDEHADSPMVVQPGCSPRTNYMQMAPRTDDGYMDMSPKGRHLHSMSPAGSTSSVTSGTPSTDMRFAEYHLEKVSSYFTPSEEEASADRPIRANSVGSRPEICKYNNNARVEMSTTPENSRVRAFSVGSRTKKIFNRVLPPHGHSHTGAKSSSAPILSNSRAQGSHGSIGPMDDLMELDFSKPSSRNSSSGYVDMKPGFKVPSGYVDMKPGRIQDVSSYVDMRAGTPPTSGLMPLRNTPEEGSYLDMDPRKNNKKVSPPPSSAGNEYVDMSFKNLKLKHGGLGTSPVKGRAPQGTFEYMDMDFHNPRTNSESSDVAKPETPDGYVEMTLGKGNHKRQSSLDSPKPNDDYANTSGSVRKKERKSNARSQPIAIQPTPKTESPVYVGRKFSTGTPPKMYLPLTSPSSTLPRQRTRANSRKDSKDSSSSSINTPSSSSTIFPISINSPCSPIKPDADYLDMDRPKPPPDTSEYVNYNPAPTITRVPPWRPEEADYALMTPGKILDGKILDGKVLEGKPTIVSKLSKIDLHEGFQPTDEIASEAGSDSGRIEVQLHYASLDLASSTDEEGNRSPRTLKVGEACALPGYAEIDFYKSEGLKQLPANTRVKH